MKALCIENLIIIITGELNEQQLDWELCLVHVRIVDS